MLPHVIVIGGGFGGLSAARALRRASLRVTLIDKRNYHLFRPMLYQVATGLLSDDEISGPLPSILSHQRNVDVLLDEVMGISPTQRIVHLKHRNLAYDFLILATGIRYNYFGQDEWRPFAPGLGWTEQPGRLCGSISSQRSSGGAIRLYRLPRRSQISLAYSATARSLENFPMRVTLRIDMRVQRS